MHTIVLLHIFIYYSLYYGPNICIILIKFFEVAKPTTFTCIVDNKEDHLLNASATLLCTPALCFEGKVNPCKNETIVRVLDPSSFVCIT